MKNLLLYLWQLPQNLVGLVVRMIYKPTKRKLGDITYYYSNKFPGGISLGKYIILGMENEDTIKHEHGHQVQSKYLGWLYLIIVGLPSIIWAALYGTVIPYTYNGYYKFYTESWADKLGGVQRYHGRIL